MRWGTLLHRIGRTLLDVVYPDVCAVCKSFNYDRGLLCPRCEQGLHAIESAPACPRCAKPLPLENAPCPWCSGHGIPPFQSIGRLGVFDEPLRGLIHRMKYSGNWPLAETFADRVWDRSRLRDLLKDADALVAVPLHHRRQRKRGYNQADVLAAQLAKHAGLKLLRPLVRIRDTHTQTQLRSQQARHENVRGAFVLLDSAGIQGRRIVVVDDVMTTGATLREVARVLLPAEPASLSALVLAIADPRGRAFQSI